MADIIWIALQLYVLFKTNRYFIIWCLANVFLLNVWRESFYVFIAKDCFIDRILLIVHISSDCVSFFSLRILYFLFLFLKFYLVSLKSFFKNNHYNFMIDVTKIAVIAQEIISLVKNNNSLSYHDFQIVFKNKLFLICPTKSNSANLI